MSRREQTPATRFALRWLLPIAVGVTVMLGAFLLFRPEGIWYWVTLILSSFVAGAVAVLVSVRLGVLPRGPRDRFRP